MKPHHAIAAIALLTGLSACGEAQIAAPTDRGVCYVRAEMDGEVRFNKVSENQSDIEHCAAELERMRLRFARLGSRQDNVIGTYQGQYLFITPEGVFTSSKIDGARFPLLVRYYGNLVAPGAIPSN